MGKKFRYPVINVEFDEPRYGYWDYGKKSGGTFEPEILGHSLVDGFVKGATIKWGCWGLNFWFNAGAGKSWKEAVSIAKRKLKRVLKVPAKVTIAWKEEEGL